MPGWILLISFTERYKHMLYNKCQNVKRSRVTINEETINCYFDQVTVLFHGVDPALFIDYDEQ